MSTQPHHGRGWAEIDLAHLVANGRAVLSQIPGSRLLPMVKADAYGMGAVPCARALRALAPWGFGVATLDEAEALRSAGITEPLLVFTPATTDDLPRMRDLDLRAVVDRPETARLWDRPFHLEIDTGMSRCGVRWDDDVAIAGCRSAHLEGVFTHLHSADTDPPSVAEQWRRFAAARSALGNRPRLVHVANSAGVWRVPEPLDLARPGVFLYGGTIGTDLPAPAPVLAVRAPVVAIRQLAAGDTVSYGADWTAPHPTTVATLGIGYADGVPRALQGKGHVLLGGHLVPIVGRVTMDFVMVDVGPDRASMRVGDIATLIGEDRGASITLDAFAEWCGTISYEVLARLGPRLSRRHRAA
jgi:alanine racemase